MLVLSGLESADADFDLASWGCHDAGLAGVINLESPCHQGQLAGCVPHPFHHGGDQFVQINGGLKFINDEDSHSLPDSHFVEIGQLIFLHVVHCLRVEAV